MAFGTRDENGVASRRFRRAAVAVLATFGVLGQGLLAAESASATSVTSFTVTLSDSQAGALSTYNLQFAATTALSAGQDIYVNSAGSAATDTVFPGSSANYTVFDLTSHTSQVSPLIATGSGSVTVELPDAIGAGDTVVLRIENVTNPTSPTPYETLNVATTTDTSQVASAPYAITAAGPTADFTPTSVVFASTPVGTSSALESVTLKNNGTTQLTGIAVSKAGSDPADFAIVSDSCTGNATMTPGASCQVVVQFNPLAAGFDTALLQFADNAPSSPQSVPLSGTGTGPSVSISASSLAFGSVAIGSESSSQTITVTNNGTVNVTITGDTNSSVVQFPTITDSCAGSTLLPDHSCTVSLAFSPPGSDTPGTSYGATFSFTDNAPGSQIVTLSGTATAGPTAALSASPSSLSLGSVADHTTSAPQPIKISNVGTAPVTFPVGLADVAITGTNAADFAVPSGNDTCAGATIQPGYSCTVDVTFTPTTIGNEYATLTVTNGGTPAVSTAIGLSGTGTGAVADLSPSSYDFGSQAATTQSAPVTFSLTDTGSAPLVLASAPTITGADPTDFVIQADTCSTSSPILPSANCTISVEFAPSAPAGSLTATLQVADNAATSPQTSSLLGDATAAPSGALSIAPGSVNFGSEPVLQTSSPQSVTVTDTGSAPVTFGATPAAVTSPFAVASDGCAGQTIQPLGACTISVDFTPTSVGTNLGQLTVTAGSLSATAGLSGTGTGPGVALSPSALNFGTVPAGSESAVQSVTLTNTGSAPLDVYGVVIGGSDPTDFTRVSNGCIGTIASGSSCAVSVAFAPSQFDSPGAVGARLKFTDSAGNSPQFLALSGVVGAPSTPSVTISPSSYNFGGVQDGQSSPIQAFTLTNSSTNGQSVDFFGSAFLTTANTSQFQLRGGDCSSATLAPGGSCVIEVSFNPTLVGSLSTLVEIDDNTGTGFETIPISGNGTGPVAAVAPPSIDFGTVPAGTMSAVQSATITDTGSGPLNISSVALAGGLGQYVVTSNTCPATLQSGDSCTVTVAFAPSATDVVGTVYGAELQFNDSAGDSPQSVALTGTVGIPPQAGVSISPSSYNFDPPVGGPPIAPAQFVVTNTGVVPLVISSVTLIGSDPSEFSITGGTCVPTATVNPNATCTIEVQFLALAVGSFAAEVKIVDNAPSSPQTILLSGTATGPAVSLSPMTVDFGTVPAGTQSGTETVTLTNTGSATLPTPTVAITGALANRFAIQSNGCTGPVPSGQSCVVVLTFTPNVGDTVGTSIGALLTFTDTAPGSPQSANLTGTVGAAPAPSVSISPPSFGFGAVADGTSSAPEVFTITNNGSATLTFTSATLVGTDPGQFAFVAGTCGATLAAQSSCTIEATFNPTAVGSFSAEISIVDNASTSPQSIPLSGNGTGPVVALSPMTVDFGTVPAGTVSGAETVTLTNTGSATLPTPTVAITGALANRFAIQSNGCTGPVPGGSSCDVFVTFNPNVADTVGTSIGALLTFTDTAPGSPQSANLTGTVGAAPAPSVSISPPSFAFGAVADGTSSAPEVFTITNNGSATLTFTSATLVGTDPGQFAFVAGTCGATLAAQSSCTIEATFNPTAVGSFAAEISIADNASTSPQSIALSGTGTGPAVSLSPSTVDFGTVPAGTVSSTQTVTLTNTGSATLSAPGVTIVGASAGQFAISSNSCTGPVASGGSCKVILTFDPNGGDSVGQVIGAVLQFTDSAGDSPQSVNLTGTAGAAPAPAVSISPPSYSFGSQGDGTVSAPEIFTITNTGSALLDFTSAAKLVGANPGQFALVGGTCLSFLNPRASCTIEATFNPTAVGSFAAEISIADNASNSPQSIPLSGTGTGPVASLSPTVLAFGNEGVGVTSADQQVTLTNTGSAALPLTSVKMSALGTTNGFAIDVAGSTCATVTSLAPGASCDIFVNFTPTAAGPLSGQLIVTDGASDSPQTVVLSGTGVGPAVSISPPSFAFGSQGNNTSSAPQTFTITNTGQSVLTFTGTVLVGADAGQFTLAAGTCASTLNPGASCTIEASFTPTVVGSFTAQISLGDNASNSPQSIPLSGTSTGPVVAISPSSVDFGNVGVHSTSTDQYVTVTNTGAAALSITTIAVSATGTANGFAIDGSSSTCAGGGTLAAGASCVVALTFTPASAGSVSGDLLITDSASDSPQSVPLTGTGVGPGVSISPASWSYGAVADGSTATEVFTITNTGMEVLTGIAASLVGTNPGQFTLTAGTCGASLNPGASCTIEASFKPTAVGAFTAEISLADSASNSPQSVPLSGTGTGPAVSLSPLTVDFGTVAAGTSSSTQTVTLTNIGSAPLTIPALGVVLAGHFPGQFAIVADGCSGTTVEAGNSCMVVVDFTPAAGDTVGGQYGALLEFNDNAGGSPQVVTLQGTAGAPPSPIVSLSTSIAAFGVVGIGSTAVQLLTVTNTGNAPLIVTGETIVGLNAGEFTLVAGTDTCLLGPVAPGSSCSVQIEFAPTVLGDASAELHLTDNAPGSPQVVVLTGFGAGPVASVTPPVLGFGEVGLFGPIATPTPETFTQLVTVTNTGLEPLTISGAAISGLGASAFAIEPGSTCLANPVVQPGLYCNYVMLFNPQAPGNYSATLVISDNAPDLVQSVQLYGTATWGNALVTTTYGSPPQTVGTAALNFPPTAVGATSLTGLVKVTNIGIGNLDFPAIGSDYNISGPDAADFVVQSDTCAGNEVPPPSPNTVSSPCTLSITFNPTAVGPLSATLTLYDVSASGSPQTIVLTGTGLGAGISIRPTAVSFGKIDIHTTSNPPRYITVTSTGAEPLVITKLAFVGLDASQFKVAPNSDTCIPNTTLTKGATCTIALVFTPTSVGPKSAMLEIFDNAPGNPQVVRLMGTGVLPYPVANTNGYWLVAADGGVFTFGPTARYHGSLPGRHIKPSTPVMSLAGTPGALGYWMVDKAGQVFGFGNAAVYGELPSTGHAPAVAIVGTNDGKGYFVATANGGVYAFGDAHNYGSAISLHLKGAIVGMQLDPATGGYWLVASDGGVFSFHAPFHGSLGQVKLTNPVVGIAVGPGGKGYWITTKYGNVFAFGAVPFDGSVTGQPNNGGVGLTVLSSVIGMVGTGDGHGYWVSTGGGRVFNFGTASQWGGAKGISLYAPITGIAAAS